MLRQTPTPGGVQLALLAGLVLLSACQSQTAQDLGTESQCTLNPTPIATIQGVGYQSSLQASEVNVRGVITRVDESGLYVESLTPDDNPATSEGLFVAYVNEAARFAPGQLFAAKGIVTELGERRDTMTSLEGVSAWATCDGNQPLPLTNSRLPMQPAEREAIEAMRVSLVQSLAVTDVYALRFGDIQVSAERILPSPTEVARPGSDARDQSQQNKARAMRVGLLHDDEPTFPIGTSLTMLTGVMAADERGPQLALEEPLNFSSPPLYRIAPAKPDDLRVLGLNLHNYFNGNGMGNGFPTPRGAESPSEFREQRKRLGASIAAIQPHIVAVMELENDGFKAGSAAADFLEDLADGSDGDWQVVSQGLGRIGSDQITVGLFYRADRVQPQGPPALLNAKIFRERSRMPLAQVFKDKASGENFLVVVNHFKSKGSCPDSGPNANQRDGQGCWNPARVESARTLTAWARRLADERAGGRVLLLGDFNAYRMEDPIQAILSDGFLDLTAPSGLMQEYSYVFRGEAGTLDYAFASPKLNSSVRSARVLNINAGFPPGVKLQHDWLRSSDHDPVVVDLLFRQP